MRTFLLLSLAAILFSGCAKSHYPNGQDKIKTTDLGAYEGGKSDADNIAAILNSTKQNSTISLDGKRYRIEESKAIFDTIKGKYHITVDEYKDRKSINVIRER